MKIIQDLHTIKTTNTCGTVNQIGAGGCVQPALIKKKELAKRLSVSARTIDTWVAKRLIPYFQITSRLYLFECDAVLAAIRKHYQVEPLNRG
jgi:excisionase family DNA binding protein